MTEDGKVGTRATRRPPHTSRKTFDYEPSVALWRDDAACIGSDAPTADIEAVREIVATDVCPTCPVRVDCAKAALHTEEQWGVWGGVDVTRMSVRDSKRALAAAMERAA